MLNNFQTTHATNILLRLALKRLSMNSRYGGKDTLSGKNKYEE